VSDLRSVADALDLVVASAATVLPEQDVQGPATTAERVRAQRGFAGSTLVLALAGGTGSGKSSLLNALAGEPVTSVGPIRPHTDAPLAWIPASPGGAVIGLLDQFGVEDRVSQDRFDGLALLDLPDSDSVMFAHRATVDRLLGEVDGVVWVVDPEKYRDKTLHRDYLQPLAGYQDQFIFVLNQIDRVGEDVGAVVADLAAALGADGIVAPEIFATAADPPVGDLLGIEHVVEFLEGRLDAKRMFTTKTFADVRAAAAAIAEAAGLAGVPSLGFEARWYEVKSETFTLLVNDEPGSVEDATCRLEDFTAALAVDAGPAFGPGLRAALTPDRIQTTIADVATEVHTAVRTPSARGWTGLRRVIRDKIAVSVDEGLEDDLGRPMREALWDRALLSARITALGIEVAQAEARLL